MNFPYHTESISQHVHHFKPIKKFGKKINYFPFAENSAKMISLIFEPFPNWLKGGALSEWHYATNFREPSQMSPIIETCLRVFWKSHYSVIETRKCPLSFYCVFVLYESSMSSLRIYSVTQLTLTIAMMIIFVHMSVRSSQEAILACALDSGSRRSRTRLLIYFTLCNMPDLIESWTFENLCCDI